MDWSAGSREMVHELLGIHYNTNPMTIITANPSNNTTHIAKSVWMHPSDDGRLLVASF